MRYHIIDRQHPCYGFHCQVENITHGRRRSLLVVKAWDPQDKTSMTLQHILRPDQVAALPSPTHHKGQP